MNAYGQTPKARQLLNFKSVFGGRFKRERTYVYLWLIYVVGGPLSMESDTTEVT